VNVVIKRQWGVGSEGLVLVGVAVVKFRLRILVGACACAWFGCGFGLESAAWT
jgi:hypothetical protein